MVVFFWMLGVVIWIALAFWPATVAKNKGHSFFGYFLLSIPFWWITLFIVYFGLQDKAGAKVAEPAA
jgi:ABC-type dipeptide/oligopeptide/nickel transport system permease component